MVRQEKKIEKKISPLSAFIKYKMQWEPWKMYFPWKMRIFLQRSMKADKEMEGVEKQIMFLLV